MSAPLVCVGDVWVLPMRTVGTRGQGGKSPPFRQGYKQNVDLLKALNCPIPQIFRPSYGPSHDSVLFLENYCGALLIIYLPWWFPINYQVANSRIARHRRGIPNSELTLDQKCSAIWNSIWSLNLLTTIKFGTWLHHEIIIESYMLTFCSDIVLILEF